MMLDLIIDTDIGEDIDDLWALVYLLRLNSSRVKAILVTNGDTLYKTKLVAKVLDELDLDITIGYGNSHPMPNYPQEEYLRDYEMKATQKVLPYNMVLKELLDGEKNYQMLCLAPLNDFASFLKENPWADTYLKVIMMGGACYHGYLGSKGPGEENNIILGTEAANYVLDTIKDYTLLPLDACYDLIIKGKDYQNFLSLNNKYQRIIFYNYQIWDRDYIGGALKFDIRESSSILYDLAVIFYLQSPEAYEVKEESLSFEKGFTRLNGKTRTKVVTKCLNQDILIKDFIDVLGGESLED